MRIRRWMTGVCVILALVSFVVPTATAAFVPKHSFITGVLANQYGNESQANPLDRLAFLTGRTAWEADARGVFAFSEAASFQGLSIDRLDVYNQSAIDEATEKRQRPTGPVFQQFFDVSIRTTSGSSLFLVPDDVGIAYSCESDFSLTTFVQVPDDLFDAGAGTLNGSHLISSGRDQTCMMQQSAETAETFVALLNQESTIVVDPSGDEPTNFTGTQWVFQIHGTPSYDVRAHGVMSPFKGTPSGFVTAYRGNDIADRFTLAPMQRMLADLVTRSEGEEGDPPEGEDGQPNDPLSGLRQIAPMLDGVLLGNLSHPVIVDGEPFAPGGSAFIRFDRIELSGGPSGDDVTLAGEARLKLVNGTLYDTRAAVHMGPLHIPVLGIVLWLVAAGAIVGSIFLKPFVGAENVRSFGLIRLLGFAFHILAFVTAFILFDFEVKTVLGTSLLTILSAGGVGQGVALGLVAFFQLLPFGLALVVFGLPIRFLANSAFRFGGLKSAKGFGKGVGNLAAWGLGALYLRVLLGGFIALAFDLMTGLTSGG